MNAVVRVLQEGIELSRSKIKTETEDQDKRREMARKAGMVPPKEDPPRANATWCAWVCKTLRGVEIPKYFTADDLEAAWGSDPVASKVEDLLALVEFKVLKQMGQRLTVRWTVGSITVSDVIGKTAKLGRVKIVPESDRLTWQGEEDAPDFRLELSLPYLLLATEDEIERGLHELLAACAYDTEERPKLKRPDIVAHASTLARYGVSGPREACAVAHAVQCSEHKERIREYGYDAQTGKGLLWPPLAARQPSLSALAREMGASLKSDGASMKVEA